MMSKEQFEQLMNKLDTLIKVTAANAFQGKSMAEGICFLSDLGFGNTEIASILGTTAAYVGNVKHVAKKTKKSKKQTDSAEQKVGEKSVEN